MRLMTIALAAGAAIAWTAAAAASPLGPPPPSGAGLAQDQCLLSHEFGRHAVVDEKTLLVDGFGRSEGIYRFTMRQACLRGAVSSDPIGLRQTSKGRICKPADVDITARGRLCFVDSIVKLSPEEAASLPRRLKP